MKKLLLLLTLLLGGSTMTFTDVDPTLNSFDAITELQQEGWVVGVGNNEYKPFDSVTRAQMAVFIGRAKHGTHYKPPPAQGQIADVPQNYWGAAWIESALNYGLMDLYDDNNFYPRNPATRADVAVLVWLLK
jgi:hypothetical protein